MSQGNSRIGSLKKAIIVCGGTGQGKSSVVNMMAGRNLKGAKVKGG